MAQFTRHWWLFCLFCCQYYLSQFGHAREGATQKVSVRFNKPEATLTTVTNLPGNLDKSDLELLVDGNNDSCIIPSSSFRLRATFEDRCLAVDSVEIVSFYSSGYISISQRQLCQESQYNSNEYCNQRRRRSNSRTYDCLQRKSKSIDIYVSNHHQICEIFILHVQKPAYTAAIRLVGGRTKWEGRVELLHRGSWGTICYDSFDFNDAQVACHQLGFKEALSYNRADRLDFRQGYGPIHMDNLQCTGAETNLQDCKFNGWGKHDCDHNDDVGIICDPCISCRKMKSLEHEKNQFPIRLIDGNMPFIGRLEIFVRNQWGTVCSDHFGPHEARVACSQLGYQGYMSYSNQFGRSSGPIWMDDVNCSDTRAVTRLADCYKIGSEERFSNNSHWRSHNCTHDNDVGLICNTLAKTLPVRLVPGVWDNSAHRGRVEIFINGLWGSVCDEYWSWNDANVLCRQLGFPYATAYRKGAWFGMSDHYHIWMSKVQCKGHETRLQDCYFPGWGVHNCEHYEDAGVECSPTKDSKQYDLHDLSRAHDPERGRRNVNESTSKYQSENLSKDIRLVNGYGPSEGRVEIKLGGLWTTICDPNWNINISNIVCNILGFSGAVEAFKHSYFGEGRRPIRMIDSNCLYRNTFNSTLCYLSSKVNTTCSHAHDIGLICFPHDKNMQQFIDFTQEYNKVYSSGKERNRKAAIFHSNLKKIRHLNRVDHFSPHEINKFMDISENEFAETHLMSNVMNDSIEFTTKGELRHRRSLAQHMDWTGPIPKCFDWRDRFPSVVTRVKDQGKCGSGWAFAAVTQIESIWALHGHHRLIELSTQQVVSCDTQSNGCDGGETSSAMNHVLETGGIQTEIRFPYRARTDGLTRSCSFTTSVRLDAHITGWQRVTKSSPTPDDEYDMMVYLYRRGPISVCLNAHNLQFYSKGIVRNCGSNYRETTHCVVLTGFGSSDSGIPYWVARNSWGEDWGDSGYFLIQRNVNMCGIVEKAFASYIVN